MTYGLGHAIHHNRHYEPTWCLEERINVIQIHKPAIELPTRLALIGLMPLQRLPQNETLEQLVKTMDKAHALYDKADALNDKAHALYDKADALDDKAHALQDKAHALLGKAADLCTTYEAAHPAEVQAIHDELWPSCAWNGKEFVYPKEGAE